MRSSSWWTLNGATFLAFGTWMNFDAWDGWSWPENVTPAQAGAEIEGSVFVVGSFVCFGVATILHEFDVRLGKRSS